MRKRKSMDGANGGGRREPALSLQAGAKWDIRKRGGYTIPYRWADVAPGVQNGVSPVE